MADEEIKRLKRTVADLRVLTDNKDREVGKHAVMIFFHLAKVSIMMIHKGY